ncbi:amino acid ABC transporter permease [Chthonobacter albigriseus]|uniref:amino acid ABC transporter permease n=1 Tax=Chthonobacter albigriseus TaxID=1683161 RepID=UPI0015EED640|nr:amino acid ABC transporter permease [Chthonobacter albigriseus]
MVEFFFVLIPEHFPFLLEGALITLQLSILSMAAAVVIGLGVALIRLAKVPILSKLCAAYVEVWRDVPLIVQLLVIFFTLPNIGIRLPGFWAGVLGLSLNIGAYLSEVFRAAISSIDTGQRDAGLSIGMSRFTVYRRVILPQAMRIALPTLGGYFISLLKDSSLVSFIAVNELLRNGTIIIANTFRSMEVYFMVAIIYFIMSFAAARLVGWVEMKLTPAYLRPAAFDLRRRLRLA